MLFKNKFLSFFCTPGNNGKHDDKTSNDMECSKDAESCKDTKNTNKLQCVISTVTDLSAEKKCIDNENHQDPDQFKQKQNTYCDGIINNFRSTVGTGILSLPIAFSQAGYVGGIGGIIFITFVTNYCATVLVRCQRELLRRNKDMARTYQGTVQAAFDGGPKTVRFMGPFFVTMTNIFIMIGQIGGVCVDLVFIASNVKSAILPQLDLRFCELLIAIPVLALSMIPNMKRLSIVSGCGNFIFLIGIGIVLYYLLREPISFEGKQAFGTIKELPEYLGTVFFSSVNITVILPMENEMKRAGMLQGLFGVINVTAALSSALYIFFGLVGYLKYGSSAQDTVTLNLPSEDWLSLAVQLIFSVSALTSIAIVLYIGVSVAWDDYLDKRLTKYRTFAYFSLRIGFVILVVIISLLVPDLQLLLAYLGIILQCTLNTTLPTILHLLTYHQQPSLRAYVREFWLDVVTCIFTIMVLACSLSSKFLADNDIEEV